MRLVRSIPALPVQDIQRAVEFYSQRLGFSCDVQKNDFARMVRDEVAVDLWPACDRSWRARTGAPAAAPVKSGAESFLAGTASCRIEVQGIDALYAEYKQQGVLYGPDTVVEKTPWSTREFAALDLERNLLTFYEVR